MSGEVQIADLDDDVGKVYLVGYPNDIAVEDKERLNQVLAEAFNYASFVTMAADIDTDFGVKEIGEEAVQELLDYAEAMEGVNRD